ncbi:MAG: hypothetical protein H6703_05160 [Myxococcales bacterium]|nr:hypothetical protein [Myxococcales bacterium]MCB9550772.1 hypothetical protein [Myxococcales bacterium]
MSRLARLCLFALATTFAAGCWGDPIAIRSPQDTDKIPAAARSKEEKALLNKLGKSPAVPAGHGAPAAAPAAGGAPTGGAPAQAAEGTDETQGGPERH